MGPALVEVLHPHHILVLDSVWETKYANPHIINMKPGPKKEGKKEREKERSVAD